jgi:methionyl-tRNA formyltransferase
MLQFKQKGGQAVRIVFMGSPELAVLPLQELMLNRYEIAAVYTRPDKPAGRGREPLATPVKKAACALNIPVIQAASLKSPEVIEQLAGYKAEAIVVAAFGQILPQAVLDLPRYGCINIHPSLLPKYRGAAPVQAAILAGDEFAGVSIMRLDAGWDTGPLLCRAQVPIFDQDTTATLSPRLFQVGASMLIEVLAGLPSGQRPAMRQNEAEASYYPEITREEGKIDWQLNSVEIWRRVRAFQPWPECYTTWQGKQLKISAAVPVINGETPEAGRVVALRAEGSPAGAICGVGTGEGVLGLLRVQIEGKRAMAAEEFMRGQRDFIGSLLS